MCNISAIICAFNEESTISKILLDLLDMPVLDEIIVVDDGSTDQTPLRIEELKRQYNFISIRLNSNQGKGFAMATGTEASSGECLVFIDADLTGVKSKHIYQLINPVISLEADMVLGQATETLLGHQNNPFKVISGQRALWRRDLLSVIHRIRPSRFGVETIINMHFRAYNKTTKYVTLENLSHPTKFDKNNPPEAFKQYAHEGGQIISAAFDNMDIVKKIIISQLSTFKQTPKIL